MATDYGKRLKLARKNAGLTQAGLKKITGIPQSTISSAEIGGSGSSDTPVFAAALSVNALWLATGEGPMEPVKAQTAAQPVSQPGTAGEKAIARLSDDAIEIAIWFDQLTDAGERLKVKRIVDSAVLQLRAKRAADLVDKPDDPGAEPTIREPAQSLTPKKPSARHR